MGWKFYIGCRFIDSVKRNAQASPFIRILAQMEATHATINITMWTSPYAGKLPSGEENQRGRDVTKRQRHDMLPA
jgi:hypothetical protein